MTPDQIQALLDEAADAYHALCGGQVADRAEQFDSHLSTVKMVVALTAEALSNGSI